ncbi:MAG TPA: hypothetical protein VGV10_06190 [Thermoleophilaceae bacterium]|nr:hypothetical protein [Thermoleophilaceae bacterium]
MAVAAGVPAAATAKPRQSCIRAHSKTVAQNGFARVYRVRTGEGTNLYACRRSTGRRVLLHAAFDDDYVSSSSYRNVRLAGVFVAWAHTSTDVSCKAQCPPGYNPTTSAISVYDLRRHRVRTMPGAVPLGRALMLSRLGGVAWASAGSAGSVEIHGSVRPGDDRVIDSGNIDPSSLTIEVTIIAWRRDGVERFPRLR